MPTSGALDVVISLFFVYLLTSLLCTSACELVASLLSLRRKMLADAVTTLLRNTALSDALFKHPLIRSISHHPTGGPSYIPRELFAAATLDVLTTTTDASLTADVRTALLALTRGTPAEAKLTAGFAALGAEAHEVKAALGRWFDDSMTRAAGAYKRSSQRIVLLVAVLVVAGLNLDTVAIARGLWVNPVLRAAVAEQAAAFVAADANRPTAPAADPQAAFTAAQATLQRTVQTLGGLELPLGWSANVPLDFWSWVHRLAGWAITVLACSLGAPFWFDLLSKLVNLRAAGRRPDAAPAAATTSAGA